jgi:hypothetical protein
MTDHRDTPHTDDERLSAYLLGELSDRDARAFEARLAADPELAAQLDALAGALVAMGGHDGVDPPAGFEDRLDERLAQARHGAVVTSLDTARDRRARSKGWWTAIGTAAAVVAVGGVMAANTLRGVGEYGGDMATEADDSAAVTEDGAELYRDESAVTAEAQGSDADAAAGAPARLMAPTLTDDQATVDDEEALLERYRGDPDVSGLLGLEIDEAADVAASFTAAVREAPPFASGGAPGDCLATVTADAQAPLIPARVETLTYEGAPAVAYVLVTATPGASELDRVETWVVTPDCTTLVFQQS